MSIDIQITEPEVAWHRNGSSGEGFFVVKFKHQDKRMMAIVFPDQETDYDDQAHFRNTDEFQNPRIAVMDVDLLAGGIIEFGKNSFRGDNYKEPVYEAIETAQREESI